MKRLSLLIALFLILACRLPSTTSSLPTLTPASIVTPQPATASPTVTPSQTPTATPVTCIVTAHVLNLRSGANISTKILDWLRHETELEIITTDGNWYKVTTPTNKVGYVHSNYCK